MTSDLIAAGCAVLVLGAGAFGTRIDRWYADLNKPSWTPPNWLFGPAWTLIIGLATFAGALAWRAAPDAATQLRILVLFGVNALLHMAWSPLFFVARRPDLALIEAVLLWVSIAALVVGLPRIHPSAALLLAPYLAWVSFAIVLNARIAALNPVAAA